MAVPVKIVTWTEPIDAIYYDGTKRGKREVKKWIESLGGHLTDGDLDGLSVLAVHKLMWSARIHPDTWAILDKNGKLHRMSDEVFRRKYRIVSHG